ncbi:MAG TPA: hypothetical protein VN087_18830 [Verrucomicrobiae bacterium]|nr:hypothetical protein [Verrucomicrobiae bacterium]
MKDSVVLVKFSRRRRGKALYGVLQKLMGEYKAIRIDHTEVPRNPVYENPGKRTERTPQ